MFDELLTQLSEEMRPFASQLADDEQARVVLALARQKRIAAANARIVRRRSEGLGVLRQQFDAEVYHRLAHKHGGYQVVNSPDFMSWLEKRMPDEFQRPKTAPDAVTVRVPADDWKNTPDRDIQEVSESCLQRDIAEVSAEFIPPTDGQ